MPSPTVPTSEPTSDGDRQREAVIVQQKADDGSPPAEEVTQAATLAPVAVAQRISRSRIEEATAVPNVQQKSAPSLEPTAPLEVIGQRVAPPLEQTSSEPAQAVEPAAGLLAPERLSYVVFALIVVGLSGLLGFVSYRRRRQA
jgi:hypothetical protein